MSNDNHYVALGVPETATQLQIRAAYRNLLKQIHPDTVSTLSPELRVMAESATRELVEAYAVLSDPDKRSRYDWQLVASRQQRSAGSVEVAQPFRPDVRQFTPSAVRNGRRRHRSRRRASSRHLVNIILKLMLIGLAVVLLVCLIVVAASISSSG